MNRIYRLIWSRATGRWHCVDENRPARRKSSGGRAGVVTAAAGFLACHAAGAWAGAPAPPPTELPTGGQVVAGQAQINPANAASLTVSQASNRAVINWQSFNIGSEASVRFEQPSAQSVALNRVLDADPSRIFGQLSANGQVFLTNPNGVYFAPGASVNVGGLVATTHGIADEDFMAGRDTFTRNGARGKVVNEGQLNATAGGYIALLAPEVRNDGVIVAQAGTVALAAGEAITLRFSPTSGLSSITVTPAQIRTLVENRHAIVTDGGQIILAARAAGQLLGSVVQSGTLSATSLVSKGGVITIEAGDIQLTGTSRIDARGANGGGTVLVGGDVRGSGGMQQANAVTMEQGAVIDASATQSGDGGKVVLWSDAHTPGTVTVAHGSVRATGGAASGNGGFVETSGASVDFSGVRVDTSAPRGATGTWLTDPFDLTVDSTAAGTINTNLASTNVTLQTTASGSTGPGTPNASGNGDIFINSGITWSSGNTLTLDAYRNININAAITAGNSGKVVMITGDTAGNGTSGSATGDYSFGLGPSGFAGSLTFGSSVGSATLNIATGGVGAASAYTLIYDLTAGANGLASLNNKTTGNYALARSGLTVGAVSNSLVGIFGSSSVHTAVFTGLGNTLTGMTLSAAANSASTGNGLFGVNDAIIRDLGVTSSSLTTTANTQNDGLLAGLSSGGVYKNVYSTGTVSSANANTWIGGLIGLQTGGSITNAYSTASVTANSSSRVGGLVGELNTAGVISNSYATGSVTSTTSSTVGGLVGQIVGPGGLISNSHASGNVSGASSIGGLVGYTQQGTSGNPTNISNSYATGSVSGTSDWVGGLAGGIDSVTNVTDSFATGNVTNTNGNGTGGLTGWSRGIGLSTITRSYASGNVTVTGSGTSVGGLVGAAQNTNIDVSFATGAVTATAYLGGLLGSSGGGTHLTDVYATGTVTGNNNMGGIAGYFPSNSTDIVINAYAAGRVTVTGASPSSIGGAFGSAGLALKTNVYWDSSTTGTNQVSGYGAANGYPPVGGGALTTSQLQSAMPTGFNSGTTNGSPWGRTDGFNPYFTFLYPNGGQAITGHLYGSNGSPAASGTVTLYTNGVPLPSGQRIADGNGAYTALVNAGSVTSSTPLGGTLMLNGSSMVVGATYTNNPTLSVQNNVSGFDIYAGFVSTYTGATTLSGAGTAPDPAAAFGSTVASVTPIAGKGWFASGPFSLNQTTSGNLLVVAPGAINLDTAQPALAGNLTLKTTAAGGININQAITSTGSKTIIFDSYDDVNFNAPLEVGNSANVIIATGDTLGNLTSASAVGDYSFALGPTGFAGHLTFGSSANSASLNIATGGTGAQSAYALIYALPAAAAGGTLTNSGKYALANNIADSVTRTAAVYTTETGITFTGLGNTVSGLNITNATASGTAGLFGAVTTSTIRDTAVSGAVRGTTTSSLAGALVGQSLGSVIKNAYSTAAVTGAGANANLGTGGLVGVANSSGTAASTLSYLIGAGTVTGGFNSGGVVGFLTSGTTIPSSLTNSSFTGATVSGTTNTGGLVGLASATAFASNGSPTISNSFATGQVTATGTGTGGLIGTMNNFVAVSNSYATGSVTQTGGVGAASTGGLVGSSSGSSSVNNNTITSSYATGTISTNGAVSTPGAAAGGLVGNLSNSTLSMTYATGAVIDTGGHGGIGGLVGSAITSTVSQSYATGNVSSAITGANFYGGLIGLANTTNINTSFATGNVSGGNFVGGLVGQTFNLFNITDVYANGSVTSTNATANAAVGGLFGAAISNSSTSFVTNAYASGAVSASGATTNIGGLFGAWGNSNGGTLVVTNGYWDSTATGQSGAATASGGGGVLRYATGTLVPTTSNNTVSTRTAGARTTTQLTNGTLPGNFNTSVTGNSNPWNVTAGFYPYFSYQYPAGAQAISGHAYTNAGGLAASAAINLYVGGSLLSGGTRTTDAGGAYTALVNSGSVTSSTRLGGTITLSGDSAITGATYTDAPTTSSGNVIGFDLRSGVLLSTTSDTTNSALQSNLAATFPSYSGMLTTLDPGRWQTNSTGNFNIDTTVSHGGPTGFSAGGNLAINAAVTSTGANSRINLGATGTVTEGAGASLSAAGLVLEGGNITLAGANNNVTTLVATGIGSMNYVDVDALTIGSVGPYSAGITASNIVGTSINTSGISSAGNITAATATGNLTVSNNIATTSGAADSTLTLKAADDISIGAVTINTASGNKLNTVLWSNTDGNTQGAVSANGSTVTTNGGHLWIGGGAGSTTWNGLAVGDGLATQSSATGLTSGIVLSGANLSTGAGNLSLAGQYIPASAPAGNNYGVRVQNSSLQTTTGSLAIDGRFSGPFHGGAGTFVTASSGDTLLQTTSGAITITGTGSDNASQAAGAKLGTYLQAFTAGNSLSILSDSGPITISGSGDFTNDNSVNVKTGMQLQAQTTTSQLTIASNSGDVSLSGSLSAGTQGTTNKNALWFNAANAPGVITIGDANATGRIDIKGDSILQQNTNATAGALALLGKGAATVAPVGSSFTSLRTGVSGAGTLTFDDDWNFGTQHSAVTIGSATNTFNLTLSNALAAAGPVSVQGGNLSVAALTSTGSGALGLVNLQSNNAGTLVQTGAITANSLDVLGAGTATLTNVGNDVTNLAASGVGNFSYVDSNALTIGTVSGIDGIGASGTVSVATLAGDLTLARNVATTDTTTSAVTLNAGQSSAAGTATGGNLVVGGGSTVSVGSGGRATLYSGSATGNTSLATLIGTGSGRFRYNSDEAASNFTTALGSGLQGIYRQAISTAIATDSQSTVYGTAAGTFTGTSGLVNGDAATFAISSPLLSTSGHLRVGSYGIGAGNLAALTGLGYTSSGNTSGTLSVTPKALGIGGITATKIYDGTTSANVSVAGATYSGLLVGDAVSVSATGAFANKHVGTGKTVTLSSSYGGTDAGNYSITGQASTLADITPAAITLSATDLSKTYDGTTAATGATAAVAGGTLYSGDTLSGGTFAYTNKNAGTGNKVVTVAGVAVADGNGGNNYNVSYVNNTASTITPAALTVSGITAGNKVYDGNTSASVSTGGAAYTGLIGGDDVVASATGAFANRNVGTGKTVTLTSSYSGTDVGNYSITDQAGTTANISAAGLTVTANADARFVTQADATNFNGVHYDGFVGGDIASTAVNDSGLTVTRPGASTDVGAGTYAGALVASGVTSGNYTITYANGDYTIVPANQLLIRTANGSVGYGSGPSYATGDILAQYLDGNGSTIHTLTGSAGGANGFTFNDGAGGSVQFTLGALSPSLSGAGALRVGNYGIGDAGPLVVGANFVGSPVFIGNLEVTQKAVTASATGVSKVYDGNTSMTGVTLGLAGQESGDLLSVNGSGAFSQKNVGMNLGYSISGLTLSGSDAGNYYLSGGGSFSGSDGAITPKALSIAGITAASRAYDGTTGAVVDTGTATYTGRVGSDDVSVSATGAFVNRNAGTAKTVNLSSSYSGADVGNYSITDQATTTANIAQAALTIGGITAASKVYDGNTTAAINSSGATYAGLIGGDDVSVSATGVFANRNAGTGKTVNLSSSYGGADLANYAITGQAATLADITQASLTIGGITAADKVYDGTTSAVVSLAGVTYGGLVGGDDVSVNATGAFANRNAGTGKTVNLSSTYSGADLANYAVTGQGTATANITPRALTISGITAGNKVYDATTGAVVSVAAVNYGGLVGGDDVSVSATGAFANKNVGVGKTVTLTSNYSGADTGNYTISGQAATTASITQAALAVNGLTAANKVYNGNTVAIVDTSGASYTGLIGGDNVALGTTTGSFADKNVGNGKAVTLAASYVGTDAGNYSITTQAGTTADITPAALAVSGITAGNKVYDGTTAATISVAGVNYGGLVGGDDVTVSATGAFLDKNSGTGKTVSLSSSYSGADLGNYTITGQSGTTANISQATLSVSGITASDKVYDGTTSAVVDISGANYSGLIGSDDVALNSVSGTFASKQVGTGKTVTLSSSYTGADAGNYSISNQSGTTASITPAALTISGITAAGKVYDATTAATVDSSGAGYSGLIGGDDVSVSATGAFTSKNAGTARTVMLTSSYSGADVGNYTISGQGSATADITRAALGISGITAANKVYDGNTGAIVNTTSASYSGLLGSDDVVVNATGAFANRNAGTGKTVTLTSSYSGADVGNYSITDQASTTANISAAGLVVTANDDARFVTQADTTNFNGVHYDGFVGGDTASTAVNTGGLTVTRPGASTDIAAGTYANALVAGGVTSTNYAITYATGDYTIVPANQLLIRTANSSAGYGTGAGFTTGDILAQYLDGNGSTIHTLTGSAGGANGFTFSDGVGGSVQFTLGALSPSLSNAGVLRVGNYGIGDAGPLVVGANFVGSPVFIGNLEVTQKAVTASATGVSKVYDGNTSMTGVTLGLAGQESGDMLSVSGSGAFSQKNVGTNLGYSISGVMLSGSDAGNYYLSGGASFSGSDGSITPKALTIGGITAAGRVYDGTTGATVNTSGATYAGLVGSDDVSVSATGTFADKNAGTGKVVNLNSSYSGADVGNYSITDQATTTASITRAALGISGITAGNKVYDGTTSATVNTGGAIYTGLIGADDVSVGATGTFGNKNVGTAKAVSLVSSYGGVDVNNYDISGQTATTANITPAVLTIGGITAANRVYDGTTGANVSTGGTTYTGLIAGDSVSVSATGAFASRNAGTGRTVNLSSTYGGVDRNNYAITGQATTTANITPAMLLVGAGNVIKTYDGTTGVTGAVATLAGGTLYAGDTLNGGNFAFTDKNAGAGNKVVTVGGVNVSDGNGGGNYAVSYVNNTTSTIDPRAITVSGASAADKTFDGNSNATIRGAALTSGGVVAGDSVTLDNATVGSFADSLVGDDKPVTTAMLLNGADRGNYSLVQPTGLSADITAATPTPPPDPVPPVVLPTPGSGPGPTTPPDGGPVLGGGPAQPGVPGGGDSGSAGSGGAGGSGASGGSPAGGGGVSNATPSSFTLLSTASVARAAGGGFISVLNFAPRQLQAGAPFEFLLPKETFVHSDPAAAVTYEARLQNDAPLPAWLQFDSSEIRFFGTPPQGVPTLQVVVIARDQGRHEARADVTLLIRQ